MREVNNSRNTRNTIDRKTKRAAKSRPANAKRGGGEVKPVKMRKREKVAVNLLSGGNPQIAKADGDAPVQAYIAAMPGWKRDVGRRLDALIVQTVPNVRKAVKWNSPFYGIGPGLVPVVPRFHSLRQDNLLQWQVAATTPTRWHGAQQGRALDRHPRGRPNQRGPHGVVGHAGGRVARLGLVS